MFYNSTSISTKNWIIHIEKGIKKNYSDLYTDDFFEKNKGGNFYFASTKSLYRHSDVEFSDGDYILFGKETKGLDEALLKNNKDKCIRIPMIDGARSLNLSNSVAIVIYEALRQNDYFNLETKGSLTKYDW